MKKFDIVLMSFPYSDLSQTKKRPALILANLRGENVISCQITTKTRNICDFEITLPKEECHGDIRFNSNIYVDMIFTLHRSLITGVIGKVSSASIKQQVNDKLERLFFP